jgi:hypothetical protein
MKLLRLILVASACSLGACGGKVIFAIDDGTGGATSTTGSSTSKASSAVSTGSQTALCCKIDTDCGDEVFTPCVNSKCKTTIPGACWSDVECGCDPQGACFATCEGAFVCPCGASCMSPDTPGKCLSI